MLATGFMGESVAMQLSHTIFTEWTSFAFYTMKSDFKFLRYGSIAGGGQLRGTSLIVFTE